MDHESETSSYIDLTEFLKFSQREQLCKDRSQHRTTTIKLYWIPVKLQSFGLQYGSMVKDLTGPEAHTNIKAVYGFDQYETMTQLITDQ